MMDNGPARGPPTTGTGTGIGMTNYRFQSLSNEHSEQTLAELPELKVGKNAASVFDNLVASSCLFKGRQHMLEVRDVPIGHYVGHNGEHYAWELGQESRRFARPAQTHERCRLD